MHRILLPCIILASLILPAGGAEAQVWFSDAQNLAADAWDGLLAPDSLVARIDQDLALIRAHTPAVLNIHYSCMQGTNGEVGLCMDSTAKVLFIHGMHEEMNALHASLGQPVIENSLDCWLHLRFSKPYKPTALIELHERITGVRYAYRLSPCAGDGNTLQLLNDRTYQFSRRWGDDCPCGCAHGHVWIFRLSGGFVDLLAEYGDDAPVKRISWGALRSLYK